MPATPTAVALAADAGVVVVPIGGERMVFGWDDGLEQIRRMEALAETRWVWWDRETALALVRSGVRPARCWDLAAAHRLLFGGWRADPARVWAALHELDPASIPGPSQPDLFTDPAEEGVPDHPIRPDGHLRADWAAGAWATSAAHLVHWAELAATLYEHQLELLGDLPDPARALATARSESAAELLGVELELDGLPIDVAEAERVIASFIGPRPRDAAEAARVAAARDARVLDLVADDFDLRNPAQVKSLLRRAGIELPDTRAWRLEQLRAEHPIVDALLTWRKAERMATTFGYAWLDEHVGADGRLRGTWSGTDGAAGRMTATAGLHNMPADLRSAIVAERDHAFVRADLGQIEPRVLAAVSLDPALAAATHEDDMYAPVAARLGVTRDVAKVAVLGAMYGQTTGHGAEALRGLESAYPVAMGYLRRADEAAQGGHDLRTAGGRRVRMDAGDVGALSERDARSQAAARGRYGRNAMIQGAAAEFFKTWAVLVRARSAPLGGELVLCLHDELLVHVPLDRRFATARLLEHCLEETARRWAPPTTTPVRFVADVSVVERWSDAK